MGTQTRKFANTITTDGKIDVVDTSIENADLVNSSITINGSAVSLGGSVNVGETKPTITTSSAIIAPSTSASFTLAGTNFISVPKVELISSTGAVGDLVQSQFKREAGVKDSGNWLPGHGGLYDRMDSIIFAAPFVYLILKYYLFVS